MLQRGQLGGAKAGVDSAVRHGLPCSEPITWFKRSNTPRERVLLDPPESLRLDHGFADHRIIWQSAIHLEFRSHATVGQPRGRGQREIMMEIIIGKDTAGGEGRPWGAGERLSRLR